MPTGRRPRSPGRVGSASLQPLLEQVANKAARSRVLKRAVILVRATGDGGGDFGLETSEKGVRMVRVEGSVRPAIEIIGQAREIKDVLSGKADARKRFLAGAFRVRGDLGYFSDLAVAAGILREPL